MVVLPAPLGPSSPKHSPWPDLQVDAVDRMDRAVSARVFLAQVLDADRPVAMPGSGSSDFGRSRRLGLRSIRSTQPVAAGSIDLGMTTTPSRITWVGISSESTFPSR